jgi:DNA polymerase elongation subunit (family B)
LFHIIKIESTSKVEVKYDSSRLVKLTKVDDNEISTPPFSMLYISVYTLSGKINPDDQVIMIKARYEDIHDSQQDKEAIFSNKEEKNLLEEFCKYVQDRDPDIIVYVGDQYASTVLDYLFARIGRLGLDLQLGRENNNQIKNLKHPGLQWIKGRLSISSRNSRSSVFDNLGLAGLI